MYPPVKPSIGQSLKESNNYVKCIHSLCFDQVPVDERALGQVVVINHGDYNFQYRWCLSERCMAAGARGCQLVSIGTAEGTVPAHDRSSCDLTFAPPKRMMLKDCTLTLEV